MQQGAGGRVRVRSGWRRRVLIHRRISFCASGVTARRRRRGAHASCSERLVCRSSAALPGAALRYRCVTVVRCVRITGKAGEFLLPLVPNGPDSDVIASCRICVTHSKHFPPFDSYDAKDAACRGNPSCMTVASSRLRTIRCTDKRCESRRRKAFRKMREARFVIGARHESAIRRMTWSDGSHAWPDVYPYRARTAMRHP